MQSSVFLGVKHSLCDVFSLGHFILMCKVDFLLDLDDEVERHELGVLELGDLGQGESG